MEDKVEKRLQEMAEREGIDLSLLNEHQHYEMYVRAHKSVVDQLADFTDMMKDRTREEGGEGK